MIFIDFFTDYQLEKTSNGNTLILYLNKNHGEFATELGEQDSEVQGLEKQVAEYVKEKFPNMKINTVKVVIGTLAIATIPFVRQTPKAFASTASPTHSHTTYKVSSGDSLYGIAKRYHTTIHGIMQMNHLTNPTIYPGQVLSIPGLPSGVSYTVRSGDSLSVIAKQYGTTVHAIKQANGLQSDQIFIGQTLTIPAVQKTTHTYTVRVGDSLSVIAKRFGSTVTSIKQQNQLTSNMIMVGQTLTIPSSVNQTVVNYTVQSGDTLSILAKQFGTTLTQIREKNKLSSNTIYVGQTLLIPTNQMSQPKSTTLQLGAKGTAVKTLQSQLTQLGFYYTKIDGIFGNGTLQSVKNFQSAYGLTVDGHVGAITSRTIHHAIVKKKMMADTKHYTGVPYKWGGKSPSGFDCSGFVYYMFQSHGVNMTRTTSSKLYNQGKRIRRSQLQPGDLVFFDTHRSGIVSHVGFYLGHNQFISATSSKGIWSYSLDNSYWSKYYVGAKRIY